NSRSTTSPPPTTFGASSPRCPQARQLLPPRAGQRHFFFFRASARSLAHFTSHSYISLIKMARQTGFVFRTWGGAREGAGRKPAAGKAGAPHVRRPNVDERIPLHVTMRVAGVPSLRSQQCIKVMRAAFRGGKERFGFRLVQYAVQSNHLHLIVEAS